MKTNKMVSVDVDLASALEERCRRTGEKQSHLIEQGLRLALGIPEVPRGEAPLKLRASDEVILKALRNRAITAVQVGELVGMSPNVAYKSLCRLALDGHVHRWNNSTWCLETAANARARILAQCDSLEWLQLTLQLRAEKSEDPEVTTSKVYMALQEVLALLPKMLPVDKEETIAELCKLLHTTPETFAEPVQTPHAEPTLWHR